MRLFPHPGLVDEAHRGSCPVSIAWLEKKPAGSLFRTSFVAVALNHPWWCVDCGHLQVSTWRFVAPSTCTAATDSTASRSDTAGWTSQVETLKNRPNVQLLRPIDILKLLVGCDYCVLCKACWSNWCFRAFKVGELALCGATR